MTSGNKWRDEKRAKRLLTPLNERTNRRFDACAKKGGCVPSARTVERIRAALRAQRAKSQCPWEFDAILAILDAEAAR